MKLNKITITESTILNNILLEIGDTVFIPEDSIKSTKKIQDIMENKKGYILFKNKKPAQSEQDIAALIKDNIGSDKIIETGSLSEDISTGEIVVHSDIKEGDVGVFAVTPSKVILIPFNAEQFAYIEHDLERDIIKKDLTRINQPNFGW